MNLSPADRKLVGTDIKDVEYAWPLGKPLVDSRETQERMNIMAKHIGSSFDSWLQQEGIYEEVTSVAIKRVLARQIGEAMRAQGRSHTEMANRMHTSRAAVERLLDPENQAVTLNTLTKAAHAVDRQLHLELV